MAMKLALSQESLLKLLPAANLSLAACAVALTGYFFMSLGQPNYFMPLEEMRAKQEHHRTSARAESLNLPAFSDDVFRKKTLFPVSETPRQAVIPEHEFVLLGVSLGEKSLAMIRDTKTNQDYYCGPGDSIGPFKVVHITKHKVILDSGSKVVEINQ
jgi:hypothetical protein